MSAPLLTRQEHAQRISAALVKGVESAVEAGHGLAIAQSQLDRPEFLAMLRDDLHITEGTSSKLKSIASHPVLSQLSHGKALPPNWSVLYALTQVPQARLISAIESGDIHPDMERKDVKALLPAPEQRDDDLPPNYEGSAEPEDEASTDDEAGDEASTAQHYPIMSPLASERISGFTYKLIRLDIELARELKEILLAGHAERLASDLDDGIGIEEAEAPTKPALVEGEPDEPYRSKAQRVMEAVGLAKKRGRPPGSKNKPKSSAAEAEQPATTSAAGNDIDAEASAEAMKAQFAALDPKQHDPFAVPDFLVRS
jgi:hypothetical protein